MQGHRPTLKAAAKYEAKMKGRRRDCVVLTFSRSQLRLLAGVPLAVIAKIGPGRRIVGAIALSTIAGVAAATGRDGNGAATVIGEGVATAIGAAIVIGESSAAIIVVGAAIVAGVATIAIASIRIGRGRQCAADHRSGYRAGPEPSAPTIAAAMPTATMQVATAGASCESRATT